MADIRAKSGDTIPLIGVVGDGNQSLFPVAYVFDSTGSTTPVATRELVLVAAVEGDHYRNRVSEPFVVPTQDVFTVVTVFYEDTFGGIESEEYPRTEDKILSNDLGDPSVVGHALDPDRI